MLQSGLYERTNSQTVAMAKANGLRMAPAKAFGNAKQAFCEDCSAPTPVQAHLRLRP
jgi:hypothetical protein